NQIDPFVPFLQLLTVKKDAVSLLGRERKAELIQATEKLFLITHWVVNRQGKPARLGFIF
ncbi:MAG: hypothetical protein D3917_21175, partial [Candidatus Electrothrix sp. AX5]|nr:hypothetical protein [Candidatus Electrothrix sp. AX5]